MSIELFALVALGIILFVSILAQSLYLDLTSGFAYGFSSRDTPAQSHGVAGQRLDRNVRNQVEGIALFLPLAVVAAASDVSNSWTQWAAIIYVVSRAVYPFAYVFGLNPVRTIIWSIGFLALPAFVHGLIAGPVQ